MTGRLQMGVEIVSMSCTLLSSDWFVDIIGVGGDGIGDINVDATVEVDE
jgi:hypothetical protein